MKIFFWLMPLFLIINGCDYKKKKALKIFEEHCQNAGLFIYEKIDLDKKYFLPLPKNKEKLNKIGSGKIYNDMYLDIDKFERDYELIFGERTEISKLENIFYSESKIIRKSDNKLLSKALSVGGFGGGLTQKGFNKICPPGERPDGWSNHNYNHIFLIKNTINLKVK